MGTIGENVVEKCMFISQFKKPKIGKLENRKPESENLK